jgi:hypothetical protein
LFLSDVQLPPEPQQRWLQRVDIFWSALWQIPGQESGITWHSPKSVQMRKDGGVGLNYRFSRIYTEEAALAKLSRRNKTAQIYFDTIGAVMMWRNATAEQISDIVEWRGIRGVRGMLPATVNVPWQLNAIQIGRPTDFRSPPWILRPGWPMNPKLIKLMTYEQRLGIFGANNEGSHGSYVRHNLLNTELSLRVSEHLQHHIPIVLGEGLGSSKILVPETAKRSKQFSLGDSVWIRKDGLRVIVEVSNTQNSITGKVIRWANSLATDQAGMRSLALLFVVPGQKRDANWTNYIRGELSDVIYKELGGRGYDAAYIASRVFVTGWEDWFPGMHQMSDRFLVLDTAPVSKKLSASVSLLDPFTIPTDVPDDKVAETIRNSKLLYGVPMHMRRDAKPLDLSQLARTEAKRVALEQQDRSKGEWDKLNAVFAQNQQQKV